MAHLIKTFTCGPAATNAYVLACTKTQKAAIIDAPLGADESLIAAVEGFEVVKILVTHSHWDHIADLAKIKRRFGVPVAIHPEDAANLEAPGSDGLPLFFEIEGVKPDLLLEDGEVVRVGELELEVIHTPGHCPGSVCFYCAKGGFCFDGDLIFRGTVGRLDIPTASEERMWKSLKRIAALPGETMLYPGHGGTTTVGQESWLSRAKEVFGG